MAALFFNNVCLAGIFIDSPNIHPKPMRKKNRNDGKHTSTHKGRGHEPLKETVFAAGILSLNRCLCK